MLSELFPAEIVDLILDYKASIEHHDKYKECMVGIRYFWLFRRICRLYAYFHVSQLTLPP